MAAYLIRRLILVIPTLFGIIAINFVIIQFAPGGPVEQMLAELRGKGALSSRLGSASSDIGSAGVYRGAQGLDPHVIADIRKMFGFDKPPLTRFADMLWGYLHFDFGRSFFRDKSVLGLIFEKLPVSLSLGLWSTVLIYLISIPLGIRKAVHDGSRFDVATSAAVLVGYALPGFLLAILLVVLFAGGSFLSIFPLSGLTSEGSRLLAMARPRAGLSLAHGFADHRNGGGRLRQPDDADEELLPGGDRQAIHRHRPRQGSQRNAGAVRSHIPQRDAADRGGISAGVRRHPVHLGAAGGDRVLAWTAWACSGFQAAIQRDYPVMFGTLYIFTLLGLVMQIVGDMMYTVVDPRIDFESQALTLSHVTQAAAGDIPGQPARLLVVLDLRSCCSARRCSPSSLPMTGRC